MTQPRIPSPIDCHHANEMPQACPCQPGCYCQTNACRPRAAAPNPPQAALGLACIECGHVGSLQLSAALWVCDDTVACQERRVSVCKRDADVLRACEVGRGREADLQPLLGLIEIGLVTSTFTLTLRGLAALRRFRLRGTS